MIPFVPSPWTTGSAGTGANKVVVYYFHQTLRCPACLEFEAFSKGNSWPNRTGW